MDRQTIDAKILSRMFLAGAKNLEAKKEWINELNVFPVPDGDTGTNMTLTIMSAASEVSALADPDMETLAKAISSGSLRGARGNSGVILSQLLRGFTKGTKGHKEMDAVVIAAAMEKAVETAYKAVMKPKEGTILTVAREAAVKATEIAEESANLELFFRAIFEHAEKTLARTPEMLPVLKEAGVVDSGGQGLLEVFRGAFDGYLGKEIDYTAFEKAAPASSVTKISPQAEAEIKFGYCTEFIILLDKPLPDEEVHSFKEFLMSIGDSVVLVADDEIVKVHVHTNHPGQAFEKALTYGALSRMKIDNMREEHQEKLIKDAQKLAREQEEQEKKDAAAKAAKERKKYGFISVSVGEGLSALFKELNVDWIIEGGQTMNPSTEDMLNAIAEVNADTIYIFPNNKNIVLAANQARDLTEDKEIVVVPTKTIPQGITALISFQPDMTGEENLEGMMEAVSMVKTGQVTYAVRDTRLDEKDIHEGDIMGIGDHGILAVGKGREAVAKEMVAAMVDEDSEVISIYYGAETSEEAANKLAEELEETYPDCEVEVNMGGQPIYYYIISVE
ncbi:MULTISPECIES: DAK2 domain-containing protein [Clostridia]|uniref:DAK2 domain-containing protein n=3 Tax=Lachnospiraceae TaxID=186803 RepID=A0A8I0DRH0_9FIRM|nr:MULTISPECIES: DAK2 domain-containing protein [Clostridia]MBC5650813.1 DAK2 domain-containing protein [Blautia segnis]MEE0302539.1 DAK2 domain-containing protein [Blautia sp.]NSL03879.1 DAK2 domain-containing protein [Blautia glucerasea]MCU6775858.1 DAK2 domain-containing protein [Blautia acetigignens]RGF74655.1 DAK2 domain-containing protein [Ruminococcus sp. AF31-8BH]